MDAAEGKSREGDRTCGTGVGMWFAKVMSKDHSGGVTYEQSFNGDERGNHANTWRRDF